MDAIRKSAQTNQPRFSIYLFMIWYIYFSLFNKPSIDTSIRPFLYPSFIHPSIRLSTHIHHDTVFNYIPISSPQIKAASEKLHELKTKSPINNNNVRTSSPSLNTSPVGNMPSGNQDVLGAQRKRFDELKVSILCVYMYVCMYVCMYLHMYVCTYVCMYVCIYIYMYMYVHIFVCMYVRMYICMYVRTYVCMYIRTLYVCIDVCMCVCIYVHMSACMYVILCTYVCMYVCI